MGIVETIQQTGEGCESATTAAADTYKDGSNTPPCAVSATWIEQVVPGFGEPMVRRVYSEYGRWLAGGPRGDFE